MQNLIGQSIGRYHILEQLGEGGMATVYRAFDTRLDCDVAIKFIRAQKLDGENSTKVLKRFKDEAQKTAALVHPNIIPVIDCGDYKGTPYMVMKYIPGGTLKSSIHERNMRRQGPYPYQQAAALLAPIARALEVAHRNGIVHRDVKPSNILLTSDGQPMLTDFGVAKIVDPLDTIDHTGVGVGIGTPEYMAPEQWAGKGIDGRADVYALGVVFYEMVTGRVPFTADTVPAILLKVINDPLPRPRELVKDLPEKVERILLKALAKRTEDRYPTVSAFAADLEKFAIGSPDPKPQRSRAWIWALLAGGIVILGLGTIIILNLLSPKPKSMAIAGSATTKEFLPTQISSGEKLTNVPVTQVQLSTDTVVASPTVTPNTQIDDPILFQANFENGTTDGFSNKVGLWQVVPDESGNKVLEIDSTNAPSSEYPEINFGNPTWTNYVLELRTRMVDYSSTNDAPFDNIKFRGNYKVAFTPYWKNFGLVTDAPWKEISNRSISLSKNTWYTVKIEVNGPKILVYLDGKLMLNENDTRFTSGDLGLGGWPNTRLQFDDIVVSRVSTVIATPEFAATLTPATALMDEISKGKVLFKDNFDQKLTAGWNPYSELMFKNGILHIEGNSNWPGLERKTDIQDQQAALLLVRSDGQSNFVLKVQSGPWGESSYKNWGLDLNGMYPLNMEGTSEMKRESL
jgi:serine/threonine protein kinase